MATQFPIHTPETAPAGARDEIGAAQKKFGFVPNLVGIMANSPPALKGYLAVSAAFAEGSLSPVEQQVVLLATAVENRCTYCVAVHSMLLEKAGGKAAAVRSLRQRESIDDTKLEALRRFTIAVVEKRGWAGEEAVQAFLDAGFTPSQVFEVVLGVAQKTLSNYINHLAGTPLDPAFSDYSWEPGSASVASR